MTLKTRVLSLVLAGSMMLSVTPVSAFAAESYTGDADAASTQSTVADGVYDTRVEGSLELSCPGGTFSWNGNTYHDVIYVVNNTSSPRVTLSYTAENHSIVAWYVSMGSAWGYSDATLEKVQALLTMAGFTESSDKTSVSFSCVRTVTNPMDGQTYSAFTQDAKILPVLDVNEYDLIYTKPTKDTQASIKVGRSLPTTGLIGVSAEIYDTCYYKVENGSASSTALTEYPTEPGTYQVAVKLENHAIAHDQVYANRVEAANVYHQIVPDKEITSENWRFNIASDASSAVNSNGVPVIDENTEGLSYDQDSNTVTLQPEYSVDYSAESNAIECKVENQGVIAGGTFNGEVTNKGTIQDGTYAGEVKVESTGTIQGGTFEKAVTTSGTLENGTYNGDVKVESTGTIENGTFAGAVTVGDDAVINGGTFSGEVTGGTINGGVFLNEPAAATIPNKVTVTVTGGAAVNGLKKAEGENSKTAVTVANSTEQVLTLSAEVKDHEVSFWKATSNGTDSVSDGSITVDSNSANLLTFTPVVVMNTTDLTQTSGKVESKIKGVEVVSAKYYKLDENGDISGEGSETYPTEDGTYILRVELKKASSSLESENGIALFAAASDLEQVAEQGGVGYYVPNHLDVNTVTVGGNTDPVTPSDGEGDSGAGAAVVLGTVAAGGAAYLIGTQIWMETNLPDGVIPTSRQQLADMLWAAAGKPEPASAALYADISAEAVDSQKAARWCVEQGLVKDHGESFDPADYTFRPQVIKAWNDLQARKAQ